MAETIQIRILEKEANRRGDLFGRLMADLFVALGYEQPHLNIHKSGRELDLSANHRLEPRRAIGECKATTELTGGDDLNKFVGSLDAESIDSPPITGYFISLAGFKETAIEQERKRLTKIVLLNGSQVIGELVGGRIIIARERATELAGRCCADLSDLILDPEAELLAHELGWIWAIYYTHGKARTHFALIHSDGTTIARALVNKVIAKDLECGGELGKLICLNPEPKPGSDKDPNISDALAAYRQYIANECGYIQLDGLPADRDIGSQRHMLEDLFVPLHLDVVINKTLKGKVILRQAVGSVLEKNNRLALLSSPGGGKSTLIKRLAVAYSDPTRREKIADNLPQRDWIPLLFRCRELRDLARGSFAELIEAISQKEPVRQYAEVFRAYVDLALIDGNVLLLVDGLDEISNPGDRAAFVCTLRTALLAYPNISAIITSREAGFRHVAAHLAPVCTHATISTFSSHDIRKLCVAWHKEVIGDTEQVRAAANELADTIIKNDRILRLAVNPLLLTTLLLVKRWIGSLPTRRSALYGKAVEVLLMTWNTEGYDPIPKEEALPQLCYVASAMMLDGVQKISRQRLIEILHEARSAMPIELGYVSDTVDQFVQRVEYRSSLLHMAGHDVENGQLVEFFEFRHLTFQEFLTAQAMVEGWHRNAKEEDTLASVLEPHLAKEQWREVIPLAAALGGKAAEVLIQRLTELMKSPHDTEDNPIFRALANCLSDEVAARPETIRAAIHELVLQCNEHNNWAFIPALSQSRYGKDLRDEAGKAFLAEEVDNFTHPGTALALVVFCQEIKIKDNAGFAEGVEHLARFLESSKSITKCEGILGLMYICYYLRHNSDGIKACASHLQRASEKLIAFLNSEHLMERFAASWALVWLGACRIWLLPAEPDVLGLLYKHWRQSANITIQRMALWAIASQPVVSRSAGKHCVDIPRGEFHDLLYSFNIQKEFAAKAAILIIAWYLHALTDMELKRRAHSLLENKKIAKDLEINDGSRALYELLELLGEKVTLDEVQLP